MGIKKEDLQFLLNRSEDWAKNADVKIGVILAFDGVVILTLARHAVSGMTKTSNPALVKTACVFALILLVWSIEKALLGIQPRLNHGQGKKSLLYYHDTQQMSLTGYKKELNDLSAADYKEQLVLQIHALAKVVSRKMICFRDSVTLLTLCLTVMGGLELWQALTT